MLQTALPSSQPATKLNTKLLMNRVERAEIAGGTAGLQTRVFHVGPENPVYVGSRGEVISGDTVYAEHLGGACGWTGGKPQHTYSTDVVPQREKFTKATKWLAKTMEPERGEEKGPKLSARRDAFDLAARSPLEKHKRFIIHPVGTRMNDCLVLVAIFPWLDASKRTSVTAERLGILRTIIALEGAGMVEPLRTALHSSKRLVVLTNESSGTFLPIWRLLVHALRHNDFPVPSTNVLWIQHKGPCTLLKVDHSCTLATLRLEQPAAPAMRTDIHWLPPRSAVELLAPIRGTPSVMAPLEVLLITRRGKRGRAITNTRSVREAIEEKLSSRGDALVVKEAVQPPRGSDLAEASRKAWQQVVVAVGPPSSELGNACVWMPAGGTVVITGSRDKEEAVYANLALACGHHALHVCAHGPSRTVAYNREDTIYVESVQVAEQVEAAVAHILGPSSPSSSE